MSSKKDRDQVDAKGPPRTGGTPMVLRGGSHEIHRVGPIGPLGARRAACGAVGAFYGPPDPEGVLPRCAGCWEQVRR